MLKSVKILAPNIYPEITSAILILIYYQKIPVYCENMHTTPPQIMR
jgi:hypothetical protein